MNAVEIEKTLSSLAEAQFDASEFPYSFLEAFGNKDATIKRLLKGDRNASDVANGVLQRSNIHLATCAQGEVRSTLQALRASSWWSIESSSTRSGSRAALLKRVWPTLTKIQPTCWPSDFVYDPTQAALVKQ